jgi:hypothetical protein
MMHPRKNEAFPSPLWGGVRGGGNPNLQRTGLPPSLPPPQGGRRSDTGNPDTQVQP